MKSGLARQVIEGLSSSGSEYDEAIKCLQKRYDKPRLLHQARVRTIAEVPRHVEGHGNELRRLHDICSQHLRALKTRVMIHHDLSFVTSLVEL